MIVREQGVSDILDSIALELDIPPHKYKEAMDRFDAIKRHLGAGDYPASIPPPRVYLQGSFRLGTVVRPAKGGKDCGFDIDIVCEVNRDKDRDKPETLKNQVGDEVKAYAKKNGMDQPKNGRRCWALRYAPDSEGIGFHVDILPCLPDGDAGSRISRVNLSEGATEWQYTKTTIAITDRNDDVDPAEHEWKSSNPHGYARWFNDICQPGYAHVDNRRQKVLLFESYGDRQNFPYNRSEDIPDELIRTPLQRAIQIMKRHRDERFKGRPDEKHKPISMIITTLAARLYEGRASQLQSTRSALRFIVDALAQHAALVEGRVLLEEVGRLHLIERVGKRWYIPNPVNPHNPGDPDDKGENFADRWHEDNHAKAKAFFRWVAWLRADLAGLLNTQDIGRTKGILTDAFGESVAAGALNRLGAKTGSNRSGALVQAAAMSVSRFNVPHREKPGWAVKITHDAVISAEYSEGKGWRSFASDGPPLPKRRDLKFRATTNVPKPFHVHWQVVNTGAEAASHGRVGLRGQIFSSKSLGAEGLWQREWTLYTGMHWIECFIVKNGALVARSGEFVVNIQ